jgi:hypothetical protein
MTHPPLTPARPTAAPTVFDCGLCGSSFTHGEQACGGCALGAACLLVRCPRCGYQFPRESLLVSLSRRLRRLFARRP